MPATTTAEQDARVQDAQFRARLQQALDGALQAKGFRPVPLGEADFLVAWRVGVRDVSDVRATEVEAPGTTRMAGVKCTGDGCSQLVMRSEETQESFGHESVKHLFYWHALEENEHKAVAFDVYRAVGGTERMRIFTGRMIRYGFAIGMAVQTIISLLMDRRTYKPGELRKSWRYVKTQPFLSGDLWRALKEYERKGFHPSDRPTGDLIELWQPHPTTWAAHTLPVDLSRDAAHALIAGGNPLGSLRQPADELVSAIVV